MKREENPGGSQLITLAIIGVVGYVGYQYLVSSGLWAQWFGGAQPALPPAGTTTALPGTTYQQLPPTPAPTTQTAPTTTVVSSALATQLQAAANQYMSATGAQGLNIDQWIFYYQTIKGITLSGAQVESLILGAGLTDATRGTPIPLATFINAMGHVGLSGIIAVPNQGPINAPLPTTQNFGRGYGGYSAGRHDGRKGYLN